MIEIPDNLFARIQNGPPGETLIIPAYGVGNQSWQDWKLRWLRSLHLDANDCIISCGFPKFMNMGEGVGEYNVNAEDILKRAGKGLHATLKIDGSLLVRFVQNGQVKWRTRGSLTVQLENAFEIDEFCKAYPQLANPAFCPEMSLLFEWVSPFNKVVLNYPEPQIFLIGGVIYDKGVKWWQARLSLLTLRELSVIAKNAGVPMTDFYTLDKADEITRLLDDMKVNTSIEGFVIRFDDDQQLVKAKTDHYKTLHALRSRLTTAMLVDLWLQWGMPEYGEYATLFDAAYDFECWQWAIPAVSSMYDGIKVAKRIVQHIEQFVAENKDLSRKDFALLAQQKYEGVRLSTCFKLLDGKEIDETVWKKLILQNSKQVELRMFRDDDA